VLDYPANGADGSYFPYDGIIRSVPGVYVDRATGAPLKDRARAGVTARLALPAQVKRVKTRNLIGFVNFGSSDELVCLHCHSDGSNAIEDNGPQALVAATQYLSRLPRNALPRTVMVLLTGHFAGGNGSQDFCRTFKNDLVKRTNAAITIEHLGLKQWEELPSGQMGPTGQWEAGAVFAPGSKALVDDSFTSLRRARPVPASVLKPLNPDANGTADAAAWRARASTSTPWATSPTRTSSPGPPTSSTGASRPRTSATTPRSAARRWRSRRRSCVSPAPPAGA
jgi:hypothetical protein